MTAHPDEVRIMGERSKQLARERFNVEICAREVAKVLKQVVKGV